MRKTFKHLAMAALASALIAGQATTAFAFKNDTNNGPGSGKSTEVSLQAPGDNSDSSQSSGNNTSPTTIVEVIILQLERGVLAGYDRVALSVLRVSPHLEIHAVVIVLWLVEHTAVQLERAALERIRIAVHLRDLVLAHRRGVGRGA